MLAMQFLVFASVFASQNYVPTITPWASAPPATRGQAPYLPPSSKVYETRNTTVPNLLNIHIVPHSHDDPGWLDTADQWYIDRVRFILETVVDHLEQDRNRTFMFVETSFLARWWNDQSERVRELAKKLVSEKRLTFANGGWAMHDEAAPTYIEMIDQTTRGHQFIRSVFGEDAVPTETWSVDPFGHSGTNAWLSSEMGMGSLYTGRISDADFSHRLVTKGLEWVFEGSASLGNSTPLFFGAIYGAGNGGYGSLWSFNQDGTGVIDNPDIENYNIDVMVDEVVVKAINQSYGTKSNHLLWAFGSDFCYQNAAKWYKNLDALMHHVNKNGTVNMLYSNAAKAVERKYEANQVWEARTDDIFPLTEGNEEDREHSIWSGYFTSRPALKKHVHVSNSLLASARQLEFLSGLKASDVPFPFLVSTEPRVGSGFTDTLEGAMSLATHHDGISGTSKQAVANDYSFRMSAGLLQAELGMKKALGKLLNLPDGSKVGFCNCNQAYGQDCLNITACPVTANFDDAFTVIVWNPRGVSNVTTILRLPVSKENYEVSTLEGEPLQSSIAHLDNRTAEIPTFYAEDPTNLNHIEQLKNKAPYVLTAIVTGLPAMGYKTILVKPGSASRVTKTLSAAAASTNGETLSIENDIYRLSFSLETGLATDLLNLQTQKKETFSASLGYYPSFDRSRDPATASRNFQNDGAYIFRPNGTTLLPLGGPGSLSTPSLTIVKSSAVQEIYQNISGWGTLVYRLYRTDEKSLEVEWTVGPIPINDFIGKNVVLRYSSGVSNPDGSFYTDGNGLEIVKRVRDQRGPSYPPYTKKTPIAGNYYPVSGLVGLKDSNGRGFYVITDNSQGGASIEEGSVELMVHRRIYADDARGVEEPLDESMCGCRWCTCAGLVSRGVHKIILGDVHDIDTEWRHIYHGMLQSPLLAFLPGGFGEKKKKTDVFPYGTSKSFLSADLPKGVQLLTITSNYENLNEGQALLRIGHSYTSGEGLYGNATIKVFFKKIFGGLVKIVSMKETQLTAIQSSEAMYSAQKHWVTSSPPVPPPAKQYTHRHSFNEEEMSVELRPTEIRTYLVVFKVLTH